MTDKLNETPTFSQILGILSVIVIPLLIWGVSVEIRATALQVKQIQLNHAVLDLKADVKDIVKTTNEILIEVKSDSKRDQKNKNN